MLWDLWKQYLENKYKETNTKEATTRATRETKQRGLHKFMKCENDLYNINYQNYINKDATHNRLW